MVLLYGSCERHFYGSATISDFLSAAEPQTVTAHSAANRLDIALVERGLAPTRSRARDLIQRGLVAVGGVTVTKPAHATRADAAITLATGDAFAASRGGEKLKAALTAFGFDPAGRVVLDVGASTGGFTELLLGRGAARVYAVDVGHGQLHPRLAADPRVLSLEGCDARVLDRHLVPEPITALVADVSFISLMKALPQPLALTAPGCWLSVLVKPQFEVGPAGVGKGGIVRDPASGPQVWGDIAAWLAAQGWETRPMVVSPITGGSGNTEYLLGAVRRD